MAQVAELEISQARARFGTLDKLVRGNQVVYVKRHKRPVFAVVGIEFLETLMETIEVLNDPKARAMLAASLEDIKAGRVLTQEEVKKQLL